MNAARIVRIFSDGHQRLMPIPRGFALAGDRVSVRQEGDRLVIEAAPPPKTHAELLDSWDDIDEPFPEIDDPPPEDVNR